MRNEEIRDYAATQFALSEIEKAKLPIPRDPSDSEKEKAEQFNEDDITNISDEDLMKYMSLFTGFQAYAEWQLARAETDVSCSESTEDFTKAELLLQAPKGFSSVKEKESWVMSKPSMVQVEADRLRRTAVYQMLKALAKGYERKANVCSRELSRRLANLNQTHFQS